MNFVNPYTAIYFSPEESRKKADIPFYKEVVWAFLQALGGGLGMYRHRVNIQFVERDIEVGMLRFGSIYIYSLRYSPELLECPGEEERRANLLGIVHLAFRSLAVEYGWDTGLIDRAYDEANRPPIRFGFTSGEKSSRDRKKKGALRLSLERRNLSVHCTVAGADGRKLAEERLLETDEDNLSWYRHIKEYGWYDNQRFGLKFLGGELWIVWNMENGAVEEIINPIKKNEKEINHFLSDLKMLPAQKYREYQS